MAGWLESMKDILGPPLSAGGGSDVGSSIGMVAGSVLGGPAGGALGSQLGGMFGAGESEGTAKSESGGTQTSGAWAVNFGGGGTNTWLIIIAIIAGVYFFAVKGK